MKCIYPAIITPMDNSAGYVARIPDVNGCITTGATINETIENIKDALAACICTLEDYNEPVPQPTPPEKVQHEAASVIALIDVDTLSYREETDTRAVRKSVSMPAWLFSMADKRGINCSQVLQEALKAMLGFS